MNPSGMMMEGYSRPVLASEEQLISWCYPFRTATIYKTI